MEQAAKPLQSARRELEELFEKWNYRGGIWHEL
jgi:hypothetical protein